MSDNNDVKSQKLSSSELSAKDHFHKEIYFPTQIYISKLHDAEEINEELLKNIREEQHRDQEGIQRSNFKSLGGWHSHNNLHKEKKYADIANRIRATAKKISKDCGYDPEYRLKIGTMWSIINGPGSFNRSHIHPGCHWSGVYYVQAPENAGRIEFTDPRTQNLMDQPKHAPGNKRPKHCWTKVRFVPEPGKLVIFPSWLYHSVEPNLAEEEGDAAERVIISFNLTQGPIKK